MAEMLFSTTDAAVALSDGLREVAALDHEKARSRFLVGDQWFEDMRAASEKVRDAVRFLCSEEVSGE